MVNFTNQILYLSSDKEIVSNPTWFKIISKTRIPPRSSMKLNNLLPTMEVDPETYEVRADGRLLTCDPAESLPMAQRYFLF